MSLFPKRNNNSYIPNRQEFASSLRKIIGFRTFNLRIYEVAFIHRSASFTLPDGQRINNERLEFLGDSVLDAILSDYLFEKFPEANEGFMTKIRSRIVNRDILNHLAISMGLDKILVSNVSSSSFKKNLYGDALEALIGALFLDKGFKKTKNLFIKRVFNKYLNLETIVGTDTDYKSLVFEWIQKHKCNLTFTHKEEFDFKLKKSVFSATLLINGDVFGTGSGISKKEAEQEASCKAWTKIRELPAETA
ncbi:MAG TPA: ribonuclease III [Bacteroidales bacterium]|nr:ribonuclease III [Bacteroidales bacterium]